MKKLSDETKALIFLIVWETFMYIALFFELAGSGFGWYLFLIDTLVQATILYYDIKVDRLKKQLKHTRRALYEQSAAYTEYVRTHSTPDAPKKKALIIDISEYIERYRKHKGA